MNQHLCILYLLPFLWPATMAGGFCGSRTNAMSVKEGVIQNECFVDVLNIIPHALLALVCIFILTVWNHSVIGKLKVKTWVHYQGHNLRWIFTLALLTTIIAEIAEGFISDLNDPDSTNFHAFVPACLACLGALLGIAFYHNVEQWNSPRFLLVLLIYWPLAIILKCLKALSIYQNDLTLDHLKVWLALIDIFFYILLFCVELNVLRCQKYAFFKKPRRKRPPQDLENTKYLQAYVNFMSQAVYWWITDLLIQGFKNPLTMKDLGKLPHSERSTKMYKKLQMIFDEQKFVTGQKKNGQPSLMYCFLKASWPMLILSGLFRLFGDCLAFVGPLLIEKIVDYAYGVEVAATHNNTPSTPSLNNSTGTKTYTFVTVDQFLFNGYVLCVILFLASILQHTLLQNHHFIVIREGIRMRTAIQTMVYSKALKLSTIVLSTGQTTLGQIMNHMSIDSTFIMFFFFFVHYIWALPIQVVLALLLMYYKLGLAALIGGLFVVCAAPVMYLLGVAMSRMQKKVMVHSDKRVKKVNEIILGMKVIKLLAWETGFEASVNETRSEELSYLLPHTIFKALMGFLGICAPVIGALLTFSLYPLIEDKPLTAGASLAVLSIFNLLQGPLQIMSLLSAAIANAKVSSGRLMPFLLANEVARPYESLPSLSKSCSINLDSAPSGHATIDKLDSVISVDGKSAPAQLELQNLDSRSCRSSICSNIGKTPPSPSHSRQNSCDLMKEPSVMVCGSFGVGSAPGGGGTHLEPKRSNLSRNATSSELLDVKPASLHRKSSAPALAVSELTGDYKRRRHHSSKSIDEDDTAIDDISLVELPNVVEVQSGQFSWDSSQKEIILKDITVKIPAGKLTMVVGQVGSGKSSLLSAFLGEMIQVSGSVHKSRTMRLAYVSQRPWLLNASLKDNILFGRPFVWRKYKKVITACALGPDIELLPAADNTEIGERGINLSGGQKQRVSIARALYSDAETVFLDAPLSALDSHTSRHVMEEAILKRMVKRGKSVVLVTHYLQYLTHAHQVIVMSNGHIHYQGKVSDVKKFDPDLYDAWRKSIRDAKAKYESSQRLEIGDTLSAERKLSGGSQSQLSVPGLPNHPGGRKMSAMSVMTEASNEDAPDDNPEDEPDRNTVKSFSADHLDDKEEKGKLIKQEHRETGAVTFSVYLRYWQACSVILCVLSILLQVAYHSLIVGANFWLSMWASDSEAFSRNLTYHAHLQPSSSGNTEQKFDNSYYLMTFVYLSLGSTVATLVGCLIIYYTGFVGSRNMFSEMVNKVIRLPMRFFDTNPSGRILNRFSSDITAIDQRLGGHVENLLRCIFFTLSAVVVNAVTTPYFLFAAVPFFILYYIMQRFFRATARELQRLDSVTKSPIFSHFSETLNGLAVIRAFGVQTDFKRRAFRAIDTNITPFLFIHTANRWLGIRLDYMSCLLVLISAVASLSSGLHGMANPAFVGLCITYALMVSGQLNWIVRITTEVEMSMNAVERVVEYTDMIPEPRILNQSELMVPDGWPGTGKIEFQNVTLSYDVDLEPVLNNASFIINGGEKIGVCGRTGSGKSSTTLALFRLLDVDEGIILLDDIDINRVNLETLRSRLAIIPQDPVLFTGTIRFNLDPTRRATEDQLWAALDRVQMREVVAALDKKLDSDVAEGGDNFSVGQRQLLCMARAFLRNTGVIVMDEATSSIDLETDAKIQHIIHSPGLEKTTIITIAHRMSTIMKYDRVMVLEFGDMKEFAPPAELIANENSIFYSLVHGAETELK